MNVGTIAKALAAAVTAAGGAYMSAAQTPGTSQQEWVSIGVSTAVAFLLVYATPNSASSDQTGKVGAQVIQADQTMVVTDQATVTDSAADDLVPAPVVETEFADPTLPTVD